MDAFLSHTEYSHGNKLSFLLFINLDNIDGQETQSNGNMRGTLVTSETGLSVESTGLFCFVVLQTCIPYIPRTMYCTVRSLFMLVNTSFEGERARSIHAKRTRCGVGRISRTRKLRSWRVPKNSLTFFYSFHILLYFNLVFVFTFTFPSAWRNICLISSATKTG